MAGILGTTKPNEPRLPEPSFSTSSNILLRKPSNAQLSGTEYGADCCDKMPKAFAAGRAVFGVRLNDLLAMPRVHCIDCLHVASRAPFLAAEFHYPKKWPPYFLFAGQRVTLRASMPKPSRNCTLATIPPSLYQLATKAEANRFGQTSLQNNLCSRFLPMLDQTRHWPFIIRNNSG